MKKISIIGAGGVIFTKNLVTDILLKPGLNDFKICLMDIHQERLNNSLIIIQKICDQLAVKPDIEHTTYLHKALEGASYVFAIFRTGTIAEQKIEYEIPAKYGIKQVVGDTLCPGGIFRALRVLPPLFELAQEMEKICPQAYLFNYVNPMSINTWALQKAFKIKIFGLCHSVQHTASQLAGYLGIKKEDITFRVAGVNHQAFFLQLEKNGQNLYPGLEKAMQKPEIYKKDRVRFEMFKHFGYFVTESSGHNSEYNPYFRKRSDLIDTYCQAEPPFSEVPYEKMFAGESGASLEVCTLMQKETENKIKNLLAGREEIKFEESCEYGIKIIEAMETGKMVSANINVMNEGVIQNLPFESCVEVPCLVDRSGIHACKIGKIPEVLAGLNRSMINVQSLTVEGFLEKDRQKIFHAVCLDPLASAVCSLSEIKQMTDEMFEALADYISPDF